MLLEETGDAAAVLLDDAGGEGDVEAVADEVDVAGVGEERDEEPA
jgi:hypothetical protein